MTQPTLLSPAPVFSMEADLQASLDSGAGGPLGRRVLNSVARGSFAGPRLRGELVAGTGDWMLVRQDGVMNVDARVVMRTHDGAVIHMSYGGRIGIPPELLAEARDPERRGNIDPGRYYFRTTPTFETGAADYAWLNNRVFIGSGRLLPKGVAYDIFEVL